MRALSEAVEARRDRTTNGTEYIIEQDYIFYTNFTL
jgi:hypothetical protein